MIEEDYGDFFTIDEFCKHLDTGGIIPYDGWGYYVLGETITEKFVDFDSAKVRRKAEKNGYRGVMWYNR